MTEQITATAESPMTAEDPVPSLPFRRRLRNLALGGFLLLLSLIVGLGIAEIGVRVIAPQQLILRRPDIWMPADSLGWVHRADVNTTVNTGERTVSFHTDEEGYRVAASGRSEGEVEILLLGDSFMEALQVEYEQSLAGILEERLSALTGEPVAVRNAAVGGWDTDQYLIRARRALASDPPDVVLVALFLGNDVIRRARTRVPPRAPDRIHRFTWPRELSSAAFVESIAYPVNDLLETRSHLFILLKERVAVLRMKLGLTAAYFPDVLLKDEASSDRWEVTADLCAEIAEAAGEVGVPTLFLLVPSSIQVDRRSFLEHSAGFGIDTVATDLELPNRLLGEALGRRGLEWLDALPALREAHEQGQRLYGTVDPHFGPEGHQVAAEVVLDRMVRLIEARATEAQPAR